MATNLNISLKNVIAWSSVGQIVTQVLSFGFGIILSRLLLPSEFGLLAMVLVFTGLAEIFKDLGFGAAIIQKKNISDEDLSTSFWINIAIGCLLTFIFFLSAPFISDFYGNDELVLLVRVVSFNFIITSFSSTSQSLLVKKVDFRTRTKIIVCALLLSSLLGVFLAYRGFGIWALVYSLLCKNLIELFGYILLVNWMPSFVFSKVSFYKLFNFGSKVTLNSFLGYLNRNTDNLIIGKFLGDSSLGIYSRVYGIMMLPLRNISSSFKVALFPVFSKIQHDRKEIKRLYLKSTRTVAFIAFPLMFGLSSVADHFVLFLYGVNWVEMVPVMRVLCIFSAFQSIMTFNGTIFYSLNKPGYETKIFLVTTPIIIVSFLLGIYFGGLLGLVWFYGVTSLLLMVFKLSFIKRLIDLSYITFFKNIFNPLIFSALMYVSVVVLDILIVDYIELHVLLLMLESFTGAVVYLLLNYFLDNQFFKKNLLTILK